MIRFVWGMPGEPVRHTCKEEVLEASRKPEVASGGSGVHRSSQASKVGWVRGAGGVNTQRGVGASV